MRRATLLALAGAGAVAATLPAAAQARWTESQLVSVDNARLEQADGGTSAVDISADGRWVVFQTTATNFFADDDADAPDTMRRGGIFRYDRTSGAIALVADGDLLDLETGDVLRRGATAPSVSDDGRWVVFSTAQRLVPQDDNDNIDVYVRDMSVPLTGDRAGGGAYQLVSARDGGDEPAHYEPRPEPLPGRNPGATVFPGQAISGDGRYVAFRTTEQRSDLPARDALDTAPNNVFVRDLQEHRTVLVTRSLDGSTDVGGSYAPIVLSRDGSTVAWVGENAPLQTRMVNGESLDNGQRYYMWRRWDDPAAVTRRPTGLSDPDDPGCAPGATIDISPTALGPCYGALSGNDSGFSDISSRAPALSADGWTVAFLSGSGVRPAEDVDLFLDAYVTSMRPGVSRKAGTRAVTRGTTAANALVNGDIESIALSADGRRLVFVTGRRQFLPPAPPLIGEPRSQPGSSELYAVDLDGNTRRVLRPGGSGDSDGAVDANAAVSADGRTIAFVSRAANLVAGDANQLADAFVVSEVDDPQTAAPPTGLGDDQADVDVSSDGDTSFGVSASSRRDGTLLLRVRAPQAGTLRAVARTPAVKARRASRGRRAVRAVKARQVASAGARAPRAATLRMVLSLKGRDRRAVRAGRALAVRITVTLRPASGRNRTASTSARFRFVPVKRRG